MFRDYSEKLFYKLAHLEQTTFLRYGRGSLLSVTFVTVSLKNFANVNEPLMGKLSMEKPPMSM